MDYFDENNEVVDLDKKIFEENYKKQAKLSKKIFLIMGAIFTLFAVIILLVALIVMEYEVMIPAIPLGAVGIIFIILGFVFPEKCNYEAIKKRQNKYEYMNVYEMNAKIIVLEEKNKIIESKIKELENEVRKIK